jgi:4'-phosphopantetheinyl transferase
VLGVAKAVFATSERELLRGAEEPARAAIFLRLWTLKEAVVKATGHGLALVPQASRLHSIRWVWQRRPRARRTPLWQLHERRLPDARLALAIRRDDEQPMTIRVTELPLAVI